VRLHDVAATLLGPLYARAADARRSLPLLGDDLACELVERLDHDFSRFAARPRFAPVVRTLVFDDLVRRFLRAHPTGTVVEIGAGLNTRFERLDNGRQRWFDVDLPEVTTLRRALLPSSVRRTHVAASIIDASWLELIATARPPVCFVFEAVLGYVGDQLQTVLARIARRFPGATLAFDLHPRWRLVNGVLVKSERPENPLLSGGLPRAIERWEIGLQLVETTRFLGWTPRRSGPRMLCPVRANEGTPYVIAQFVAALP
jgi:O-methyltransferase involved in polyketide biosynthesis